MIVQKQSKHPNHVYPHLEVPLYIASKNHWSKIVQIVYANIPYPSYFIICDDLFYDYVCSSSLEMTYRDNFYSSYVMKYAIFISITHHRR